MYDELQQSILTAQLDELRSAINGLRSTGDSDALLDWLSRPFPAVPYSHWNPLEQRRATALKAYAIGAWTGYDRNTIGRWIADGRNGPMPKLSIELKEHFEQYEEERPSPDDLNYRAWLQEKTEPDQRQKQEDAWLRRHYPDSYAAFLQKQEWLKLQEEHKKKQELEAWRERERQRLEAVRQEQLKQQTEAAAKQEEERARYQRRKVVLDVLLDPDRSLSEVPAADYLNWLEFDATEDDLALLDKRFQEDANRLKEPAVLRWFKKISA